MCILYLMTSAEPAMKGTDAVFQEVECLGKAFNGLQLNLFPFNTPNSRFPKLFYGVHCIKALQRQQRTVRANHIFAPTLGYLPIFSIMGRPIIYTATAGLEGQRKPILMGKLRRLHRVVVSSRRDKGVLDSWGLDNTLVIRPGIDTSRFSVHALPLDGELIILLGSAPWESRQFRSKGVDLLLAATAKIPFLRLLILWRGLLFDELTRKIQSYGVSRKIRVLNENVDVNSVLKMVHATILLAERPDLVKAFPHSLMESLVAGKPVVLSKTIPMSEYVARHRCGVVVESLTGHGLTGAIERLRRDYEPLAANARHLPRRDFSIERTLEEYGRLYSSLH